jgi:arginyl-tRNA synthetase
VHHILQVSKYTAIKRLVYSHLLRVLSINTFYQETANIKAEKIPLHKGRDEKKILYISGVALWLAKSQNRQAMEIAQAIASHLLADGGDVFYVQIVPPGWIHLELTNQAIATWLQNIAEGNLGDSSMRQQQHTGLLFSVQHAHARCCSLALLGHREGLIKLGEPLPNTSACLGNLIDPNPIPWLNCEAKLRLQHSAESRLISELVQVVDDLASHSSGRVVNWEQTALSLSQTFESFWSQCRIWGEVKINSPQLAQARLGLIVATQSVLRFVLAEKLGVFAPSEL